MCPGSQLAFQLMDYEGTLRKFKKVRKINFFIDVEPIPSVHGASRLFPRAPRHRKMIKILIFLEIQFDGQAPPPLRLQVVRVLSGTAPLCLQIACLGVCGASSAPFHEFDGHSDFPY